LLFDFALPVFLLIKTILVDAVNTFVINGQGVFAEMHTLLEQYPNPKIVLTNADDEQAKKFGLDRLPYPVFSLKHHPEKTDPEYFRTMLDHYRLRTDEVVYFEHNPAAVESARSVSIATYHYDPEQKDLVALKVFLDTQLL
jgi:HAD superfamily hydrolase (TIGR01509 family)